ncbi:hypothetical protein ACFL96_10735 [Thermoproteota archaeon]
MQIEQTNLVTCEACSNRVSMKEMKFDLNGTSLICLECYEEQRSRSTRSFERKDLGASVAIERRLERAQRAEDYIYYKCDACSHSFSRKASFVFKKCPNCGDSAVSVIQKNSAQKIVDGSNQDLDLGIDFL